MPANLAADYTAAHATLDAMGALPEGWNSYGAAAIPPAPIAAAHALLDEVAGLVRPAAEWTLSAVPDPWGGVVLHWWSPALEIEAQIVRPSCEWSCYIQETGGRPISEERNVPRATVLARLVRVLSSE